MSTPSNSASGNIRPASTTMMSSPQRMAMQFMPNSPSPPSGTTWSFPAGMCKSDASTRESAPSVTSAPWAHRQGQSRRSFGGALDSLLQEAPHHIRPHDFLAFSAFFGDPPLNEHLQQDLHLECIQQGLLLIRYPVGGEEGVLHQGRDLAIAEGILLQHLDGGQKSGSVEQGTTLLPQAGELAEADTIFRYQDIERHKVLQQG